MIALGLPKFHRYSAMRLEGKSQVENIPICVSSEGRIMPCCTIVARLSTSACASRQAPCVPCWIAFRTIVSAVLCLFMIIYL